MAARCARCVFRGYISCWLLFLSLVVVAAALMRRRNAAANVNRPGGPVAFREERLRGDAFLRGTIGFLVREVMSVPRRNAVMRLAADRQGGRYVNQSSIRRRDTVTAMKSCLSVLE